MFSSAEKSAHVSRQTQTAGATFFRKAGEESFFGAQNKPAFFGAPVQAKLSVSKPDDPQEKEADAVADKVMRMAEPPAQAATVNKDEDKLQKQEEEKEEVQAKSQPPAVISVQRVEEKKEEVQTKLIGAVDRKENNAATQSMNNAAEGDANTHSFGRGISPFRSDIIQCSGRGPPASSIPFEQTLSSSKGGGSSMPDNTQQFMESRFGADFSGVKIHTGSTAENLSNSINAQAFAHGNDIYFNSGKYSPNTADGGALLAHELTHTIQQGASKHTPQAKSSDTPVAAKLKTQPKKIDAVLPSLTSSPASSHAAGNAGFQKKPQANNNPRSLRDLRKDAFNIDRKEDHVNEHRLSALTGSAVSPIQQKAESKNLSSPSSTNTSAVVPAKSNVQPKEDVKENKKEEEVKLDTSVQPVLQKKALSGLQQFSQGTTLSTGSNLASFAVQSSAENTDGILPHEIPGATASNKDVKDRGPPSVQTKSGSGPVIQRSWLGDAWDAVSNVVSEAADIVARGLDAAKEWILRRIRNFVQNIPGYNILALILQQDPVTHEPVERSGRNILLAGLQLIPGGSLFRQVLERVNAINEAGAWIDGRMGDLLSLVSGIGNRFTQFINGLSLDDIGNPEGVLNRVADLFSGIFRDVTGFMERAAVEFLEMIKRIMLRLIVDFVRARIPRLYPLLRVALGHDPVTGEEVPRNGHNILYAALDVTDAGREQRRQMEETGTFDRVAAWIDRAISVFTTAYVQLRQAFTNLWSYVTIENLFSPIETFTRIYNDFAAPINLVSGFLGDLAIEIIRIIKEALLRRLSAYARTIRGYPLVTVIIGRDPFTGEIVPRTVPNLIRGFMSLMEGGEEQYRQMEELGAIARTTQRIEAAVARLNMTPAYIIALFTDLWRSFGLADLAHPIAAFQRIVATFGEPIGRLIDFVIEIVKIVVHVILEIMNFPFDLINNIITRAMAAFDRIKRDPIGFLKNLLRAIKQGFIQFFDHILTHLLNGLTGWLMSELRDANVPAPTDFSLRGIIGWVLQVLGISMEAIWAKLAAHPRIGPQRVARIRGMISTLEGDLDVYQRCAGTGSGSHLG